MIFSVNCTVFSLQPCIKYSINWKTDKKTNVICHLYEKVGFALSNSKVLLSLHLLVLSFQNKYYALPPNIYITIGVW